MSTTFTPSLPAGYTAVPGRLEDYKLAWELFNIYALHHTGAVDVNDPELIRVDWQDPKFDLARSILWVFAPNGALVGHVEVWDTFTPPVHPWIWGCVHPDHGEKGIGSFLLDWAEKRACQALPRVEEGLRFAPRIGTVHQNQAARNLFEKRGFVYTRSFYRMETHFTTPPSLPPATDGITIRPVNIQTELEAVVHTVIDSFRDHYGFVERPFEEELQNFQHHFLNDPSFNPKFWFVAMDGDQMAGICLCRPEDYENTQFGFVNELGVRREWRKRGIGTALLLTAFHAFYQNGSKGAALGVDASNLTGALKIYEQAGMHAARQFDNFEKELRPGKEISTQTLD